MKRIDGVKLQATGAVEAQYFHGQPDQAVGGKLRADSGGWPFALGGATQNQGGFGWSAELRFLTRQIPTGGLEDGDLLPIPPAEACACGKDEKGGDNGNSHGERSLFEEFHDFRTASFVGNFFGESAGRLFITAGGPAG